MQRVESGGKRATTATRLGSGHLLSASSLSCPVLQCVEVSGSVLQCAGVCWSVLECVGVCWSVLQ